MNYERDENKRLSNLAKHKLDFADAWAVLEDSHALTEQRVFYEINKSYIEKN